MLNRQYHIGLSISLFFVIYSYELVSPIILELEPIENTKLTTLERASLFITKIKKILDLY